MKKIIVSIVALFGLFVSVHADGLKDVRYTEKDVENFNEVMTLLEGDGNLPMNEKVIKVAKHFLGTPYVSYTLELEPEMLTVNTRQTDCILFVEMCLAMCLTSNEPEPTFEKYVDILRSLRYRNGVVDGYASRLHYTSEWIIQGNGNGYFDDVAKEIGGSPLDQKFFFMSTHTDSYKQLKNNPEEAAKIKSAEERLNGFEYYFVPKSDLVKCAGNIKSGDIIGFNSSVPGLDIAHVAYAYWEGDTLTFIHASYSAKKVIINKESVIEYLNGNKSQNGLRVVRLR